MSNCHPPTTAHQSLSLLLKDDYNYDDDDYDYEYDDDNSQKFIAMLKRTTKIGTGDEMRDEKGCWVPKQKCLAYNTTPGLIT